MAFKTLTTLALTSTLLAGSSLVAATTNCSAEVTSEALAVVANATYLNSCAPGSTWKLTTLFEATNLSATDIVTFCNATECMHPMHELLDSVPEGCVATVAGKTVELNAAIAEVHDKCHMTLHKSEGSHEEEDDDDDDHDHAAGATSNSSATTAVPSPAPTTKSAASSVPLAATLAVFSAASAVAALVL